MANLQPIFDYVWTGTGSVTTETWVDLGVIPSGKQVMFGYGTFSAEDKACQFELRANTSGTSTGTTGNTTLLDWSSAVTSASIDRDLYKDGNIHTVSLISTGVEHTWLRVRSKGASGIFDYLIYHTIY